jgi:hypothetical protein
MKQRKTLSYSKNREKKRHYHRNIEVSFQEEPKKGNKRRKNLMSKKLKKCLISCTLQFAA